MKLKAKRQGHNDGHDPMYVMVLIEAAKLMTLEDNPRSQAVT